jgi:hypothetical protein
MTIAQTQLEYNKGVAIMLLLKLFGTLSLNTYCGFQLQHINLCECASVQNTDFKAAFTISLDIQTFTETPTVF